MTTIDKLSAVDQVYSTDQVPIWSSVNGDARKASMALVSQFVASQIAAGDDKDTQYSAPLTGTTVQVTDSANSVWLILTPAGTLAALTIALPAKANCADKQEVLVNTRQTLTSLTVSCSGGTVVGAPTTLAANGYFRMRYDAVMSTWYRVG